MSTVNTKYGAFQIDRVIGFFDVWTQFKLPFAKFTLKIIQEKDGGYYAIPNVMVYNTSTKCIEHTCGIGASIELAIEDAINMMMSEIEKQEKNKNSAQLEECDFVWLNWQPYVQLTMPPTW